MRCLLRRVAFASQDSNPRILMPRTTASIGNRATGLHLQQASRERTCDIWCTPSSWTCTFDCSGESFYLGRLCPLSSDLWKAPCRFHRSKYFRGHRRIMNVALAVHGTGPSKYGLLLSFRTQLTEAGRDRANCPAD